MTELTFEVTPADTAETLGSGEVPVLATPRLLAWCEAATVAEAAATDGCVGSGETSVGTRIALEHLAPSPVGARLRVAARMVHRDGRLLRFEVRASDADTDQAVAHGEVTRVVVDRERFLSRLGR
jgi:predicted thioesterase